MKVFPAVGVSIDVVSATGAAETISDNATRAVKDVVGIDIRLGVQVEGRESEIS